MGDRVSVAMATYNGARFLPQQLASLAGQSRPPDELVVVDDASTDRTREILRRFARRAPFEVAIETHAVNRGVSASFEAALTRCRGDVLFLCDQDDVWDPSKIAEVLAAFESRPSLLLILHDLAYVDGRLLPTGETVLERFQRFGFPVERYVHGCAMAVRSVVRDLALPLPPDQPHDVWLRRQVPIDELVSVLPKVLARYRIHGDNATTGDPVSALAADRNTSLRSRWSARIDRLWPDVDQELEQRREALTSLAVALDQRMPLSSDGAEPEHLRALREGTRAGIAAIDARVVVRRRSGLVPRIRAVRAARASDGDPYHTLPRPRLSMLRDELTGS